MTREPTLSEAGPATSGIQAPGTRGALAIVLAALPKDRYVSMSTRTAHMASEWEVPCPEGLMCPLLVVVGPVDFCAVVPAATYDA